ncbi:MAG: GNAT family N-acetyltransferase [SAR324 cluster bacterium]|nr:GNAT family N-acetyltransferase [SAR324 cluster bacterium]
MQIKIFDTLQEIPSHAWSPLTGQHFPFSEYHYLLAMEEGQCVGKKVGWVSKYLTVWENEKLTGAIYLYIKDNSYGEYIFDWGWVNAYAQHGFNYYPKLLSAVPFTPATGNKILIHPDFDYEKYSKILLKTVLELAAKWECHSLHFLFIPPGEVPVFENAGFLIRHSHQFHWKNRNYTKFDDFLSVLKGKRRKEIIRERRKVAEQGICIELLTGEQISQEHCQIMYEFYLSTTHKKGACDYLSYEFFQNVFTNMKKYILLIFAKLEGRWVAGTINYHKGNCLYGRYWGCLEDFKHLHFELCYYQAIEYAIAHRIELFEAGAQGPHKIQRGFLPEITYSAHWIEHPGFRAAISDFLEQEKDSIADSLEGSEKHMPYRMDSLNFTGTITAR